MPQPMVFFFLPHDYVRKCMFKKLGKENEGITEVIYSSFGETDLHIFYWYVHSHIPKSARSR